ncbi:MAG TPA: DNA-processing protein DprA [Candidatus Saccharimonadales bacterium]|nr:DNA-processing protein DprA [Candidatus Saccharimonadales bacterium]
MPIFTINDITNLSSSDSEFPDALRRIPSAPPQLYVAGQDNLAELLKRPRVAIVGSRKITPYGKAITAQLAGDLARQGIVIVSGLAFGVDAAAHKAALEAGGGAIAVLPTSLQNIYPASNQQLAHDILKQGGALVSEYAPDSEVYKTNFVARNRLIAGLADAVLITEAALKSGSLHTARFALEQGKDVLAVPGNITSEMSEGTNNLLKAGATPVTSSLDVLHALGLEDKAQNGIAVQGSNEAEQVVLDLIASGVADGEELQRRSELPVTEFNQTLTMLEITGKIRSLGANQWTR